MSAAMRSQAAGAAACVQGSRHNSRNHASDSGCLKGDPTGIRALLKRQRLFNFS